VFEMFIQPLAQPCLDGWGQAQNQANKAERFKYLKITLGIDNHMCSVCTQPFKGNRLGRFVGKLTRPAYWKRDDTDSVSWGCPRTGL